MTITSSMMVDRAASMRARRLSALTVAPAARDWLDASYKARILHIFDHVCNLINEYGEVLSIVSEDIGDGPFNLVVGGETIVFSNFLNIDSQIFIDADQMILGNIIIKTRDAKLWSSRPDWGKLRTAKESILDQLRSLPILSYQPQLPGILLSALSASIATADIPSSLSAARSLAGLGAGLTPAGDDFILGAILAAWVIHPFDIASIIAEQVTNAAAPLTTSLSAAWLKSAGRGEAGIRWHRFFDALISTDRTRVQDFVDEILAIGHTSGADALAGFSYACLLPENIL